MNKINLHPKGFINGNFLLVIELISEGKYGEYLNNIDYLFEGTKGDQLIYHPYSDNNRCDNIASISIGVNNLEYEDRNGILYVREHIKVYYYNNIIKKFNSITIYNESDIKNFLNTNEAKVSYVHLSFKDKPYKVIRVYHYINHMQYIEGITIPTIPTRVKVENIVEDEPIADVVEPKIEEEIIELTEPEVIQPKKTYLEHFSNWVNSFFKPSDNIKWRKVETVDMDTFNRIYSEKSPHFYDKEEEFISIIEKEISYTTETYTNNTITLKGTLIIDEISFRIDLSKKELEDLSTIK